MIKEFIKPVSGTDAVELKNKYEGSIYYSGGTEINNEKTPKVYNCVISLEKLGLNRIEIQGNSLEIGASVTIQTLIDSNLVPSVLREASMFIYSRNIRNIATIGGNIGAGKPDSALTPCLIALSAELQTHEEGVISVEDYIAGNMESLILSVSIPVPEPLCTVRKISRTVSSVSIISASVSIIGDKFDISKAIIAVGGIGSKVSRLESIEKRLESGELRTRNDLEKAVSNLISPVSDLLGSAAYKKYITGAVVADCVSNLLGEIK